MTHDFRYAIILIFILLAAMADVKAPRYNPNPISKLPLKPTAIDDTVVRTVPITDAITFTPQSRVISSLPMVMVLFLSSPFWDLELKAILVIDGN